MDPLTNVMIDSHDYIFQHFNGQEIKELSKVAKNWYITIGNSRTCMKELVLCLRSKSNKTWPKNTLSNRKYVKVFIDNEDTKNFKVHRQILQKFAPDLMIFKVMSIHKNMKLGEFDFPKVKGFDIEWYASEKTVERATSLTKRIKLESLSLVFNSEKDFELLRTQDKLKHLSLEIGVEMIFTDEKFEVIESLKLKSLQLNIIWIESYWDARLKQNMLNFLDSQAQTIEKLTILTFDPEISRKVLSMPFIHTLEIDLSNLSLIKNLPTNKTVKIAEIKGSVQHTKYLIHQLPNLKEVYIRELNTGMLQTVAESALKLEKLFFNFGRNVDDFYEKLKMTDKNINQNIQLIRVKEINKFHF